MVETGSTGRPFPGWQGITEDITPAEDADIDLGDTDKRFARLYVVIAVLTSMVLGGIYLGATTEGWLFINASTQMNGSLAVNGSGLIWEDLAVIGTNVSFANANVTALYYSGDGSLLTGIQQGTLNFFLHNETSVYFPNSKQLDYALNDSGKSTISATITASDQSIVNFSTDEGIPGIEIIPPGMGYYHIHGKQTAGTKIATIYYKFYAVFADNSTSLIATSGESNVFTGDEAVINVWCSHEEILLNSTDRFLIQMYGEVSGAGTDPQIELYIEGHTASRFSLPGPVASTANFVPYTGAIKNLDLGSYNITADYFIGNGSQLTDITLTETDPYWTGNQSSYYLVSNPFSFYNSTNPQTETDPYWTGNQSLYLLDTTDTFTGNLTFADANNCIIFNSGGKICSGT